MRRLSQERYDYYFAPLPNTPFSMGLAIPSTYGNTLIKVGDEVRRNLNVGVNMSEFFVGENWKIHPDWYDKMHSRNISILNKLYILQSTGFTANTIT